MCTDWDHDLVHTPSIAAVGFFLLLATSLPNTASAQLTEDHLKCYKVKDPLILKSPVPPAAKEWLRLTGSQFGEEKCRVVGGFRLLCVPVTKEIITDPRGKLRGETGVPLTFTPIPLQTTQTLTQDQVCYKIKCEERFPSPPNPEQEINDQFATRTLEKLEPFLLCGPAQKPCGDATAPACDGFCAEGESCVDIAGCVCLSCNRPRVAASQPHRSPTQPVRLR